MSIQGSKIILLPDYYCQQTCSIIPEATSRSLTDPEIAGSRALRSWAALRLPADQSRQPARRDQTTRPRSCRPSQKPRRPLTNGQNDTLAPLVGSLNILNHPRSRKGTVSACDMLPGASPPWRRLWSMADSNIMSTLCNSSAFLLPRLLVALFPGALFLSCCAVAVSFFSPTS